MISESAQRPRLDLAIYKAASEERRNSKKDNQEYYPRVSNAGACSRALVYRALGVPIEEVSSEQVLLFADGNWHETITTDWLSKTPYIVTDSQRAVDICDIPGASTSTTRFCETCNQNLPYGTLHGHIDGIIHDPDLGKSFLWEHKGLGEYGFDKLNTEYSDGYVSQCCCYIRGLRREGEEIDGAILLVKAKNKSSFKQIFIQYDDAQDIARVENEWNGAIFYVEAPVQRVIDLHAQVEQYRNSIDMPDRPYDYDDWQCRLCPYFDTCWNEHDLEIAKADTCAELSGHDALAVDLEEYNKLRNLMKDADARAKELRRNILTELSSRDIRKGITPNLKFSLSAMRKESVDTERIPEHIKAAAMRSVLIRTLTIKEVDNGTKN